LTITALHEWLLERPRTLLAAALVLVVLAVVAAGFRLRLSVDIAEMLPADAPAASAYRELLEVFGTFEKVVILVRLPAGREIPAGRDPVTDAAVLLEEILSASPHVEEVRAGIGAADERFFMEHLVPRAALFLSEGEMVARVGEAIRPEALAARARQVSRRFQLPGGEFLTPLLVRDPLGFADELPGLELSGWGLQVDLLSGMFRSADGEAALAIVTPRSGELDAAMGRKLREVLDAAQRRLRDEVDRELELLAVGGPLYAAEDETLIRRDLEVTVTSSMAACTLLLLVAFGGWRVPAITAAAIAVALVWTAGALALGTGQVAALSLGFAAVLVGLGVDYCIHGGTRFEEASRAGLGPRAALDRAVATTAPAILTSALTTAAAFGVLMLSDLRPLAELGAMVAVGMLAMLLATFAVGGPLALILLRRPRRTETSLWRWTGAAVTGLTHAAERRPRATLLIAAALLAIAMPGLLRLRFDTDLRAIRPAEHATVAAEHAVAEAFGLSLDTATVLVEGSSTDEAFAASRRAADELREALGAGASVESPTDWILGPGERAARLAALAELPLVEAADRFEVELRAVGLRPEAFSVGLGALRELGHGRDPAAPLEEDLPSFVRESVHLEPDGGALLALHVRLAPGTESELPAIQDVLSRAGVTARVASTRAVAAELGALAVRDGRRLGALAGFAVCVLVLLRFGGRWRLAWRSLVPVLYGATLTLGFWGLLDARLDLVSVAVLPILFGIGVDNGLHVVHGAARDGDLGGATRVAGRAMVLTALTTAVGFASLLLSSIPGLRRGGALVAVGVVVCVLATVTLLPALGSLRGIPHGADDPGEAA
jgi:uncharacterized protein